ncbi:site-specific integrase [Dysgonomonas sp. Marseille-P4361]|uniref:site-specific integrase n=1 Tax=Dysgonomonas sp. Marseille-P4361 TaxID=2161820 RepID=UPI000D553710|nr:site-specific integrase [Dysgonomonas sp. Marseille-P4361]
MKTNTDFAKFLSRFLSEYLPHERNMSPNTILSYRDTFVQFITYMRDVQKMRIEKLTLEKLTRQIVLEFLAWIQDKRNCCVSTRNYRLAAIHSFVQYLQYEDIVHLEQWQKILSVKAMKAEKKSINYLTVDAIKLLLEQPDTTTAKGRRNLALLALMYDTGARVQEIIDLTPGSINIAGTPYTIRLFGKGRKYRIVPLMEEQVNLLRKYLEENNLMEEYRLRHPLFFNNRREKLTRSGVAYVLKTYTEMARIINPELIPETVSCHSLRHSKAMHLLQAGVNLVYIRDILGHCSIQTTDIYARADSKQKREALEKSYTDLIPKSDENCQWERNQNLLEWLNDFRK